MITLFLIIQLTTSVMCVKGVPKSGSPVIDKGAPTPSHCSVPGQNSGCIEWLAKAPDMGACEFVPSTTIIQVPTAPTALKMIP